MRASPSGRLRVAVVGGGIGTQHIDALIRLPAQFELAAFCDIDPARAEAVAKRYEIGAATTSYDELLARDDIDIVDLCTPAGLHVAQTSAALEAGKHVICEKPLAASLAEVDGLAALAETSGRHVSPIFQYRFGNGYRRLLHLRDAGLLGKTYLATVETHWQRGASYYAVPWRGRFATELGGSLTSHAIHAHDMLMHALGPIRSVHARTATRVNPIETEDCAVVSLELADGALAALSVTMGAASEHSRLRFYFERVTVESNLSPYRPHLEPWRFEPTDEAARAEIDAALADFTPLPEHFEGQFARLHAALTQRRPPPVTLADSRAAIELLTAAYYSARSGEAVSLPIAPEHPYYHGWRTTPGGRDG
jgi:predicted dehydrogenase